MVNIELLYGVSYDKEGRVKTILDLKVGPIKGNDANIDITNFSGIRKYSYRVDALKKITKMALMGRIHNFCSTLGLLFRPCICRVCHNRGDRPVAPTLVAAANAA